LHPYLTLALGKKKNNQSQPDKPVHSYIRRIGLIFYDYYSILVELFSLADTGMPNLDLKAAHEFWKNYEDPMIFRVISFMETAEDWTLDGDSNLEQAIDKLGNILEQLKRFELGKEDQFIDLCCHLKTSRILRLLQAVDTIDPGSASKLLMYAEEHNSPDNVMAGLFLRRNIIFERLRLLARVFSPDRFEIVLKALEHENV
jgi:intracellular multiplication protein IcmW